MIFFIMQIANYIINMKWSFTIYLNLKLCHLQKYAWNIHFHLESHNLPGAYV